MKEQDLDEPLTKRLRDYAIYNTRDPAKAPRLCAEALMLIEECAAALAAVIAVADRKTVEFDMARATLLKATSGLRTADRDAVQPSNEGAE